MPPDRVEPRYLVEGGCAAIAVEADAGGVSILPAARGPGLAESAVELDGAGPRRAGVVAQRGGAGPNVSKSTAVSGNDGPLPKASAAESLSKATAPYRTAANAVGVRCSRPSRRPSRPPTAG